MDQVDETSVGADETGNKDTREIPDPLPGDWLLRMLVEMVDEMGLGLTLSVQGTLISGTLISGNAFLKQMGTEMGGAVRTSGEKVERAFAQLADKRYPKNPPSPRNIEFIHLADARVFSPGGKPIPANRGVLFRARITEVGAFTVGKLAVEQ